MFLLNLNTFNKHVPTKHELQPTSNSSKIFPISGKSVQTSFIPELRYDSIFIQEPHL